MVSVGNNIDEAGMNLKLNGLAEGTYWLVETDAPAGYNKLTAPIKVTITKSGNTDVNNWGLSKDDVLETDKIIDVENSTGTLLPETGGMGTVLFTVVAVVMILGVAISFIRSRKIEE
jgi:LPXTG-motif cell wall-anchored protein